MDSLRGALRSSAIYFRQFIKFSDMHSHHKMNTALASFLGQRCHRWKLGPHEKQNVMMCRNGEEEKRWKTKVWNGNNFAPATKSFLQILNGPVHTNYGSPEIFQTLFRKSEWCCWILADERSPPSAVCPLKVPSSEVQHQLLASGLQDGWNSSSSSDECLCYILHDRPRPAKCSTNG